ncbi:hypothetical protein LEP1GSC062_0588 [Leptospira alexanderi serovar Manhao 3 str. L 60]|uniref:Uncharacterized protein n=1 Tax=Leptospira alexanderi serovar Manhao 3 str. L 60 TaxID=1049759 RepID=V6I3B5_9LEPT|nr:hypothetical protein LEP1GSC062_0588 [Leptospira alexanderi serovar Manhao 3 str. L 60]
MTGFLTVVLCLGVAAVFFHLLYSVDTRRIDNAEKKETHKTEFRRNTEILKKSTVKIGIPIFLNPEFVPSAENTCKKWNVYMP